MTNEDHDANTTSLAAAQQKTSPPEPRLEHEDPTKDDMSSKPSGLRALPNLNNPFDLPNGKQVQKPYDHTTEKVLIVEEYEVGKKEKSEFASDEYGTIKKRKVVCGFPCLSPIVLLGIAATVVILVIALGVGLGVGLKK
jgi:hypothetical protein